MRKLWFAPRLIEEASLTFIAERGIGGHLH